jgi:hypothetical protein
VLQRRWEREGEEEIELEKKGAYNTIQFLPYENGSEGSGNIRPGYVLNPNSTFQFLTFKP